MTLIERLRDLHKQATVERSHYYVGKCALDAADRIEALEVALEVIAETANYLGNGEGVVGDLEKIARAALNQQKSE